MTYGSDQRVFNMVFSLAVNVPSASNTTGTVDGVEVGDKTATVGAVDVGAIVGAPEATVGEGKPAAVNIGVTVTIVGGAFWTSSYLLPYLEYKI
jgi:hypothetical protein